MPGTHNVDEVFDDIKGIIDSFGFHTTIEGKTMALDCAGIIADYLIARSIDQQEGPDGPWDALSAKYLAWKAKKGYSVLIGVRTGGMISLTSMIGDLTITDKEMTMLYGTGAADSVDPDVTDIEKGYFFSKRRPFYVLDDTVSDLVFARIEQTLADWITREW